MLADDLRLREQLLARPRYYDDPRLNTKK